MLRKRLLVFILIPFLASAQEKLSLQDAIATALKNNYAIQLVSNDAAVAKNNNTPGNAGILPDVLATGNLTQTVNALKQNYTDGRVVDKSNVASTSANAGVELNWVLFDGLKMFVTKNKLEEIAARGELNVKIEMENTIEQVIAAYFNVAQQKKLIAATDIIMGIDSERVALAQTSLDVGSGSRLDLLQAKVDLNEQVSIRMKQSAALEESKDQLSYLLSRGPDADFVISDSIVITYHPDTSMLRKSVPQHNRSVLAAQSDQKISLLEEREYKSMHAPVIGVAGGYSYARTKSAAGLLLLNQSNGFNYGVNVSWNLFNGFTLGSQIKNARLEYESSGLRLQDIQLQISVQLEKALRDFNNNVNILTLEQENILLVREDLDVAFERYRSGLSNSLELKNAQLSFQNAESRLVEAQYASKISETELMRLNGELVK